MEQRFFVPSRVLGRRPYLRFGKLKYYVLNLVRFPHIPVAGNDQFLHRSALKVKLHFAPPYLVRCLHITVDYLYEAIKYNLE